MVEDLSAKLCTLVAEDDEVSVIWFSGRGEHGIVVERAKIPTLRDLSVMQKALARWLKPIGLTGFKEPLDDARRIFGGSKGENLSLFFLSDGHDNQWPREEILQEVDLLAPALSSATVVEYGYYADRAMLSKMAERFGGAHVFAEDFVAFEPTVRSAFAAQMDAGPRTLMDAKGAVGDVAFCLDSGRIRVFDVVGGVVSVPSSALSRGVHFLSKKSGKNVVEASLWGLTMSALYGALSVFSVRMMPEVILPILRELADVRFIRQYGSLFGKQAYSTFMMEAAKAAFDDAARGLEGFNKNAVPADDAFTVIDLLNLLEASDCRLLLDHDRFVYDRISRKRVDATEGEQLVFEVLGKAEGYEVRGLTWNEDRANVSVKVRREGVVNLRGRLPFKGLVPERFETFDWRNYAIVADGLRNVDALPVRASSTTISLLLNKGVVLEVLSDNGDTSDVLINVSGLPVLNRAKVARVSAKELFAKKVELECKRAALKVYKTYQEDEERSETWDERYGKEGADWLRAQGLGPGGYQPPETKQVEATDYYLGKVLKVSIKGWSSLPKVSDVTSGKAKNGPALYMKSVVDTCEAQKKKLGAKFSAWVAATVEVVDIEVKALCKEIAQLKFAIIVGGVWFPEFKSIDERAMLVCKVNGVDTEVEAVMKEEKILL